MRAVQVVGREALDQLATLLGLLARRQTTARRWPRGPASPTSIDCSRRSGRLGFPCGCTTIGEPEPMPAALDGAAYRVIQEALTNALKHSGGAPTDVTVRFAADGVHLDVVDTGSTSHQALSGGSRTGRHARARRHTTVALLRAGHGAGGSGFVVSAFLPYPTVPRVESEHVHA